MIVDLGWGNWEVWGKWTEAHRGQGGDRIRCDFDLLSFLIQMDRWLFCSAAFCGLCHHPPQRRSVSG